MLVGPAIRDGRDDFEPVSTAEPSAEWSIVIIHGKRSAS
jgi:hypothetical protein